jgi:uncharacterized repeat protein (TIGR03806 family)
MRRRHALLWASLIASLGCHGDAHKHGRDASVDSGATSTMDAAAHDMDAAQSVPDTGPVGPERDANPPTDAANHDAGSRDASIIDASVSGLDTRPSNATCHALPRPLPKTGTLTHELLAPGITFPGALVDMKRGPKLVPAWFGVSKVGTMFALPDGSKTLTTILDKKFFTSLVYNYEEGLLSLAVDPAYPNPDAPDRVRIFTYFTSSACLENHTWCSQLRRFDFKVTRKGTDLTFDINQEVDCEKSPDCEQILTVNQPAENHNAGALAFGKDGYLYLTFGDGGGAGACNSLNLGTPHGKLLRLDVHAPAVPYAIPADNPYASVTSLCNVFASSTKPDQADNARGEPCPEIMAAGFRNPFRIAPDRATGEIWIGDVGSNDWEETDLVRVSAMTANAVPTYGWPRFEAEAAFHAQDTYCDAVTPALRLEAPYQEPRAYLPNTHVGGYAVVGGYVYRGSALGDKYAGRHFFAELSSGNLWAVNKPYEREGVLVKIADPAPDDLDLLHPAFYTAPYGFAEDDDGELIMFGGNEQPARLVLSNAEPGDFPTNLADTGCVDPQDASKPAAGLIPYDVNVPLWSDGADKERYLALPDGATITRAGNCDGLTASECETVGDFDLPIGSVLMKVFRRNGVLLETRLLMRHDDGDWAGYTYVWNAEQTAATLTSEETTLADRDWVAPSRKQCLDCHTRAAGRTLGLELAQLNRDFTYPGTGRTRNQLATWSAIGLFDQPITGTPASLASIAPNDDASARARGYLHANCSHCHRPGTPIANMDLRYFTPFAGMNVCKVEPVQGMWPTGTRLLVPTSPASSLLSVRPHSLETTLRMPPIGSRVVDDVGVAAIDTWIESIAACQ